MSTNNETRIKEICNEITDAVSNANKQENTLNIMAGIEDSIYWVNTYQLINSRRDELKLLGFEHKDGDNTHFIEDVKLFSSKLIEYVNRIYGSFNYTTYVQDGVPIGSDPRMMSPGYYTVSITPNLPSVTNSKWNISCNDKYISINR